MATNTNLQKIYAADELNASSATYVAGSEDDLSSSHRRQIEEYVAGGTIVANDLVSLDLAQTGDGAKALVVVQADTGTATSKAAIGFALNSAATGEKVSVTIAGIHQSANVAGATLAGSTLCAGSTAGQAAVYANSDVLPIIAVAAEADTANVATVFVIKQF